jgi:Tfp pilus assembly protein PilP
MRSVKTLILGITLAAATRNLHAQDAGGAAQQVRKSAEQAAAQAGASANKATAKPATQAPSKPATPAPAKRSSAASAPGKPAAQAPAATKAGASAGSAQAAKPATAPSPGSKNATGKPVSAAKPKGTARAAGSTKKAAAKKPSAVKRTGKPKSSNAAENAQNLLEGQTRMAARRDPFEAMLGRENAGSSGKAGPMPPGKAGLQVSTLRLDGVVRAPNGMIAVVSNPQSRTYFLREGDQLYDGRVEKIAMDGVSFHEVGKDAFGKPVERQVNKRIYASAGEQQ